MLFPRTSVATAVSTWAPSAIPSAFQMAVPAIVGAGRDGAGGHRQALPVCHKVETCDSTAIASLDHDGHVASDEGSGSGLEKAQRRGQGVCG